MYCQSSTPRVYFPTYSNGLKEIAGSLGFEWSDPLGSGLQSIVWRHQWEHSRDSVFREKLIAYNADDCAALSLLIHSVRQLDQSFQGVTPLGASKASVNMSVLLGGLARLYSQRNEHGTLDRYVDLEFTRLEMRMRKHRRVTRSRVVAAMPSNRFVIAKSRPILLPIHVSKI
jgi:hypothetical protein